MTLPHYEVHDGEGPYLVLLHGMLSSRAQWMLNLEALSAIARPVVVELWGHGRSPAPDDPALYHPDGYVATLERLREELGAARWCLCGQSFGAGITLRSDPHDEWRETLDKGRGLFAALSGHEDDA